MITVFLPWLIGLLSALALVAVGYAAVDVILGISARIHSLGSSARYARGTAALGAYRVPAPSADRIILPPALHATLAILRRPKPLLLVPAAGGVVLAVLGRDFLFSPFLAFLGLGVTLYLAYRQTLAAQQGISDEVRRLVDAFVGLYRVNPTTFTTLGLAAEHIQAGPVHAAALAAVRHYEATRDT
ncbi:MAG: hypothetical protein FJZ97_14745, partial [Chloroflexi bacterium]|nr:hypothetical protein [Chloroflexota bacterium]